MLMAPRYKPPLGGTSEGGWCVTRRVRDETSCFSGSGRVVSYVSGANCKHCLPRLASVASFLKYLGGMVKWR